VFAEAGLDVAKINKIRADHQREVRGVLEKEKSKSAKAFATLNKNLRSGIENQKKALEHLASQPLIITRIPLWTAFDLTVLPGNLPYESHAEAANNWVTVAFEKDIFADTSEDGTVDVYFWFYWRNPFSYAAVLNADSQLVLQGTYDLTPQTDFIAPGDVSLDLWAELFVVVGGAIIHSQWTHIPPFPLEASADWFIEQDEASGGISGIYHVSTGSGIAVPAGKLALFAVHFLAKYNIFHGTVAFDFDSPGQIMLCPSVQLELLIPLRAP
jgi:hypothetical protein